MTILTFLLLIYIVARATTKEDISKRVKREEADE